MASYAVLTTADNESGILFGLTRVLADHRANITQVDLIQHGTQAAQVYLEFSFDGDIEPLAHDLRGVPGVSSAEVLPSFAKIYGKRIIIMGGGAQVGQVA